MRHHLSIRRFLNRGDHHAGAYVVARVPDRDSCAEPGCNHLWCGDIVLDIADCSRVVHLSFELASASDRRNSLHKANVLVDVLTRFRDALEVEAARTVARTPTR